MADLQAAKRYAQAAFGIARDAGAVASWRLQLDDVASVLSESGLAPVLADSRVPVDQRTGMVERVLDVDPMVLNLARLLVAKGGRRATSTACHASGPSPATTHR